MTYKVAILMGSPNDMDKMQPGCRHARALRHRGRRAGRTRPTATPAVVTALARIGPRAGLRGVHLRRRHGRPPGRRGRRPHHPPRGRRAAVGRRAQRRRRALLHRADAQGHPGGHRGHRRLDERRPAGRRDARHHATQTSPPSWPITGRRSPARTSAKWREWARVPGAHLPNVLAARYASEPMAAIWSPEHKVVLERQLWIAVLRAQRDLGVDIPDRGHRRLRGGRRQGRPREHRRPRAGHQARREGPHRGVLRPRRPRAHPRRHDLARPHRERRAAPGARRARAGARPHGHRAGPPGRPRRRARHARDHRAAATTSPRRPPRMGKRFANAGEELLQALRRVEELLARYPLRGIKGPVGTQQDMLDLLGGRGRRSAELEAAVARHLGFDATLTNVGQVYPRSLDLDVGRGARAGRRRARQPGHHDPADGRPRAGHRGLQAGPGRLVGHAPQDEQPLLRADQRPARGAAGPPVDGRRAGRRPVERGRRVVLGRAPGGAARRLPRRRRPLPDLPRRCSTTSAPTRPSIARELERYLPFLTTTKVLMGAVRAGVGREVAHEAIKEHAVAVALGDARAGCGRQRPARPAGRRRSPAARPGRRSTRSLASRSTSWAPRWPRSAAFVAQVAAVVARHPDAAELPPEPIL